MNTIGNPFIIGVTGQRDNHPASQHQVWNLGVGWLDVQISTHGESNIVLHSPLAVGADQLVALLAIKRQKH
ncbi:hypothetical protein V7654_20285 [Bacillus sp. JJ1609]|uniref:hypothetical protein n=1 Tax=Bacillus sp. JJ1609 TaxID=3122977 RepID=UPI002FFEE3BE